MAQQEWLQADLLDRRVVEQATLEDWGRVEMVWMHPPAHRVLGFICRQGRMRAQRYAFRLDQVRGLGEETVMLTAAPVVASPEKVERLQTLIGAEVWSEFGDDIGRIIDCVFDPASGRILAYRLMASGGLYRLLPEQILSLGRTRVVVGDRDLEALEPDPEGMPERFEPDGEELPESESYQQLVEDWRSRASRLKQKARSRLSEVKGQAKELIERLETVDLTQRFLDELGFEGDRPALAADRRSPLPDWEEGETPAEDWGRSRRRDRPVENPLPELQPRAGRRKAPLDLQPLPEDDDDPWV